MVNGNKQTIEFTYEGITEEDQDKFQRALIKASERLSKKYHLTECGYFCDQFDFGKC